MRIACINTFNYSAYPQRNLQNNGLSDKQYSPVFFTGLSGKDIFIRSFRLNPIKHFKTFTKEEYKKLSHFEKNRIRLEYKNFESTFPLYYKGISELHKYAADCLKTVFDKRFGTGKYVVVPIGRSVSSIGKVLGFKIGEENVKNIPMSNAQRFYYAASQKDTYGIFLQNTKNEQCFDKFLQYLSSIGLGRKEIENSGKNYLLIDYCYSGESLRGAEQLFKSELVWGNVKQNIFAVDVLKAIDRVEEPSDPAHKDLISYMKYAGADTFASICAKMLLTASFKQYAAVGAAKTFADTLYAVPEKVLPNLNKDEKLFWFNLLDSVLDKPKTVNLKLKNSLPEENIFTPRFQEQNVEIWQDVKSQYRSDLENDINEINKLLIRMDSIDLSANPNKDKIKLLSNDIMGVHRYLRGSYLYLSNSQYRYRYYAIRNDIHNMINELYNFINK